MKIISSYKSCSDKYEKYKPSGVDWIGEIPEGWEVPKITYLFRKIGSGTTPTAGSPLYYENGTINFLQTGDLNDGSINATTKKITKKALLDNSVLKIFPKGSLVIAMYGATIGKLGILNLETTTNQACCVLGEEISNVHMKYIFYWFYFAKPHIISMSYGGGQPNISQDLIKSLRLQLPPLSEQTAIAEFLDDKTAKIDQTIAIRQKEIELLKERRQILIQQAVTKGLDATVKLKDSGVDWIGEIPEHWEVRKLKYLANVVLGKMICNENKGNYKLKPYLKSKNIQWMELNLDSVDEMWFSDKEMVQYKLKKGDIVVSEGGEVGKATLWNDELSECYIQNSAHKVSMINDNNNVFFLFLFFTYGKLGVFDSIVNKVSIGHLTREKLMNIYFPVAPVEEQTQIVSYLEDIEAKIAKAIMLKEQEIEKLKEYKTVLIDNVVTGKVRVS